MHIQVICSYKDAFLMFSHGILTSTVRYFYSFSSVVKLNLLKTMTTCIPALHLHLCLCILADDASSGALVCVSVDSDEMVSPINRNILFIWELTFSEDACRQQ